MDNFNLDELMDLLMAAYGGRGVLDRPNMRVMRWRNGALSGSDLANEPGLGSSRTYQPGEMPMPSKPKPGLTRMHREMYSEATSSASPLRAAVPPKRAKVTQKVQTNQTHTRSGRDERSAEKYGEGAGRDDQKHAPDGGRSGHVEKVD